MGALLLALGCGTTADRGAASSGGAPAASGAPAAAGAPAASGGSTAASGGNGAAPGGSGSGGGGNAGSSGGPPMPAAGGSAAAAGGSPGGSAGTGAHGGASGAFAAGGGGGLGASGHAGASPGGTAGSAAAGASGGSATCTSSTLGKGNLNRTLKVGATSRSYILHVPSSYTGTTPVPLVLDFHGLGGSGSQEQSLSGYQQLADREGFLIAFPDGIDNAWNIGPCCTNSRDVDDLGFAKAMVAAVEADGCVDPARVYATGFSMGGGMSQYLACNAADVFAAVAPASFDLLVPDEEPCAPSRPISVIAFRGTADTVVPFAGGKGSSGRVTFLGAQGSFDRWAGIDDCMEPTTADGDCTYYEHCGDGTEIGLCVKQGGSHAPGDAEVGWAFLKKFTLP